MKIAVHCIEFTIDYLKSVYTVETDLLLLFVESVGLPRDRTRMAAYNP
jgi:hypothetical protein